MDPRRSMIRRDPASLSSTTFATWSQPTGQDCPSRVTYQGFWWLRDDFFAGVWEADRRSDCSTKIPPRARIDRWAHIYSQSGYISAYIYE
ncbi:hypothetical protein PoMZ_00103 [Pyricularia oryzae]|uniref:Uncharacterized protein n=1 Tax=Pyricularia oryzae TaxID=318829 RepID=A0A4P7MYZ3_PYROR|nr:hypothetical protein PoMZ_00103 [Pyricularia oryzae]